MTAPDFAIFEVLRRHGVPFVIIGGHAVNFHGYFRLTEDSDVVWLRSKESELSLFNALTELEAVYIGKEIDPATRIERAYPVSLMYVQTHPLMMLCTRCGFFDLFSYVPSLPETDVTEFFTAGIEVDGFRYASKEWLVRMKRAAGRTKDLLDLENLP